LLSAFWRDLTTLLAFYDGNDNLVWRFEYAEGRMPVAMTDGNGTRYYLHYDQVGSLRAVSDSSGNIVKEIIYDTYGNVLSDSDPGFKASIVMGGWLPPGRLPSLVAKRIVIFLSSRFGVDVLKINECRQCGKGQQYRKKCFHFFTPLSFRVLEVCCYKECTGPTIF
jgi:hypothetical protein